MPQLKHEDADTLLDVNVFIRLIIEQLEAPITFRVHRVEVEIFSGHDLL